MSSPSNRTGDVTALTMSLTAAVGSVRVALPWDIALVIAAAVLSAFALASWLASLTA